MNSAGINVARAIGPTVGGAIIVAAGAGLAFLLNAVSEVVILAALLLWTQTVVQSPRRAEQFLPAIVAGVRYALHSASLKTVLLRAAAFFLFASAFWALLPLVVRTALRAEASTYGVMVGAVGFGAVCGALLLPRIDRRLGPDRLVTLGTIGMAAVLAVLGLVPALSAALAACFAAGLAWIFVLSSLNVAAQNALPDWVRGRGLSIYGFAFFGSMTVGALLWGALASALGLAVTLAAAGAGTVLALGLMRGRTLPTGILDLSPAGHWPDPVVALDVDHEDGPVLVQIEYRIDPARAAEFTAVMQSLSSERRRDGAYNWELMRDTADPALFTECFHVASWAEHEHQHA
ncbi:MAG: MFS transporter, partial [Nevskiales bacterium]